MHHKLLRFALVGGLCAVLFFSISYIFLELAGLQLAPTILLTYPICIGVGYGLQHKITFKATTGHRRSLPRYLALQAGGVTFVYYVTLWLRPHFALGSVSLPLIVTAIAGFASFVISLTWVFEPRSAPRNL